MFKKSTLQKIKQPLLRRDILTVWRGCWLGALNGAKIPFQRYRVKSFPIQRRCQSFSDSRQKRRRTQPLGFQRSPFGLPPYEWPKSVTILCFAEYWIENLENTNEPPRSDLKCMLTAEVSENPDVQRSFPFIVMAPSPIWSKMKEISVLS